MIFRWLLTLVLALPLAAAERPNLILIFADDLGYGDLSSFGSRNHKTPHLDRMAEEGVRFTDFYVPTPYCAPSRATILTGRYPFRNTVVSNPAPDGGNNSTHLPLEEITIAEALKPLGYATGMIGKWHLGHLPQWLPTRQGFDEYYGILYSNDMRPVQQIEGEKVVEYPVFQPTLTKRYTERALDFIERNKDQPFFLYLPHAMPHKPLAASEDFYTPDTPDDLYSDVIRELDWSTGQILAKLKELGLDGNTLVVFTSDNGPWYGGETAGLRGMKSVTWEGGIRVPMIARWPGKFPANREVRHIAGTIDMFPTFVEAAGGEAPADRKLDGKSLLPLLTGQSDEPPHEAIYAMRGPEIRVVRSGKWKLHVTSPGGLPNSRYIEDGTYWKDPRGPDGLTILGQYEQPQPTAYPGVLGGVEPKDMMLFDLEADLAEQRDVAAQNPEVVKRLKVMFDAIQKEVSPDIQIPAPRPPGEGLMWLKGGELRYDEEIKPIAP